MPSEIEEASLRDILHHIDLVQQFTAGKIMKHLMPIHHGFMLPPLRAVIVAELSRFSSDE
jgi:hypothetical protein